MDQPDPAARVHHRAHDAAIVAEDNALAHRSAKPAPMVRPESL